MLEKIEELDRRLLTSWECDFIENVTTVVESDGQLSDPQIEALTTIFRDKVKNVFGKGWG